MKTMKFETFKKKIIESLDYHLFESKKNLDNWFLCQLGLIKEGKRPFSCRKELSDKAKEYINRADVRQAHELAEMFDDVVPSWVKTCNIEMMDGKNGYFWLLKEKIY